MNKNIMKGLNTLENLYLKYPNHNHIQQLLIDYYSQFFTYNVALQRVNNLTRNHNINKHPKFKAWYFSENITLPDFSMGTSIPKVLYQTCHSSDNLPEKLHQNIANLKKLNPKWKYCLYEDVNIESFIKNYYGNQILEIYQTINPIYGAARADFFRYLLIYALGGIYLDIKSIIHKPLDQTLNYNIPMYLSHWNNGKNQKYEGWGFHKELARFNAGEYQQWHIISVAGHPFLRNVIKRVIYNITHYSTEEFGVGCHGVLKTTGPIPYTLAIESNKSKQLYNEVKINDLGFEYTVYENTNEHHKLSINKHYSELTQPLIL